MIYDEDPYGRRPRRINGEVKTTGEVRLDGEKPGRISSGYSHLTTRPGHSAALPGTFEAGGEPDINSCWTTDDLSHGVVLPLGFATPGAYRLQESDTYLNFTTSSETFPGALGIEGL